jgi:hypothetical protein
MDSLEITKSKQENYDEENLKSFKKEIKQEPK